jgi:hypothetical protein
MNARYHDEALSRILTEYLEMPDLKLTVKQAGRLLNLPADDCAAALASLVRSEFLFQSRDGQFMRRSSAL